MKRQELIKSYIEFFKTKNHKEIVNSSLIPENDPTVLFTTAGMHPLVPFLLGQEHPQGKRLVNVQRCIRTGDIEEVGDKFHHTFFEMLGNWSLGDYGKKKAIKYTFEFLNKELKIPKERLAVSVFLGDKNVKRDKESSNIWRSLGIPQEKIVFLDKKENWWDPAGKTGPCGPDTEIFYWNLDKNIPKKFNPKDSNWVEIGNNVLMEYYKDKNGKYIVAKQKNIDFGGGVERTLSILQEVEDNYLTEIWKPIIKEIEKLSKRKYEEKTKEMRIIADHIKAAAFILNDGVIPSNTEQGYVLRRLIRRAIRYGKRIGLESFTKKIAEPVFKIYNDYKFNKNKILEELEKEEEKFNKTLENGLKIFEKMCKNKLIDGKESFLLYQSYGFPIEMTQELAKEKKVKIDLNGFEKEMIKHQKLSKTATTGKFKSGLADHSEKTTRLHTTAHLLLAALKKVLKNEKISQKGSNINPERLRLDFSFDRKLTEDEIEKIEKIVNEQIKKETPVVREEMTFEEAKKQGAEGAFEDKYKGIVSVYTIGSFSKELCTGPHVKNTKEIGRFKIIKEQSSSSGVRRIKATIS